MNTERDNNRDGERKRELSTQTQECKNSGRNGDEDIKEMSEALHFPLLEAHNWGLLGSLA